MNPTAFDWHSRTRVVFGAGSAGRAGELARELGGRRVLLVTDPGIVKAGHTSLVQNAITKAGLEVTVFDRVHENPTTRDVDDCLAAARSTRPDIIVAVGGGSSMDTAKGCNFLLTNGGRMQDYWGVGKASKPMLPLIAIPTTAGTGSECQSFALIADEQTHQKMACGDPKASASIAILDPVLTVTQPRAVTAATGLDAVTHAVETAVTRKRNALSAVFSREAFRHVSANLPRVLAAPDDLDARAAMQVGAAMAGAAIENSMLGAAHSAANPLTARFNVVHGDAVAAMLPHVVRFNSQDAATRAIYDELSPRLADLLDELLAAAGVVPRLRDHGVPCEAIPQLAEEAARQWTAQFNPRLVTAADFVQLYEGCW